MDRSGLQRVIPVVLILIIVVVAIAALVSIGRTLFSGGDSQPLIVENPGKQALTNTTADRSVKMTVRGPIVAKENFHSYSITASPDKRSMITRVGYTGTEIDNEQLENNTQAYTQFVHALSRAGLMEGTPLSGDANDTRGICATGTLYEFEVLQGDNSVQKLWTSTCKGSLGSLEANLSQVRSLFQRQIPDFAKLSNKVNL